MKILTKAQANRAVIDSLFRPGGTLALREKVKFCTGQYQKGIIGKDVDPRVAADYDLIWAEPRRDADGPYFTLYAIRKVARSNPRRRRHK